jgi:hypothetical protein
MNPWIQEDEKIKTKSMVEKSDDVICLKSLKVKLSYVLRINYYEL